MNQEVFKKYDLPSEEIRRKMDKKQQFRQDMLERIRSSIGYHNQDQQLKEVVLLDLCLKITSLHISCLEEFENGFGADVWGHKLPNHIFSQLSEEEQYRMKEQAKKWSRIRAVIRTLGNETIDHVLKQFGFLKVESSDEVLKANVVN